MGEIINICACYSLFQQFDCKLEGLPDVGVACVNEAGERVSCCVAVEWIYAMVSVYM